MSMLVSMSWLVLTSFLSSTLLPVSMSWPIPRRRAAFLGAALFSGLLCPGLTGAGHELPFYPGYYPQEIRLDTLAPAAAAPLLQKSQVQAYVGADPFSGRKDPADLRSVESFG